MSRKGLIINGVKGPFSVLNNDRAIKEGFLTAVSSKGIPYRVASIKNLGTLNNPRLGFDIEVFRKIGAEDWALLEEEITCELIEFFHLDQPVLPSMDEVTELLNKVFYGRRFSKWPSFDPFSTLVWYTCSPFATIKRIKQMYLDLRRNFGVPLDLEGWWYAFPSLSSVYDDLKREKRYELSKLIIELSNAKELVVRGRVDRGRLRKFSHRYKIFEMYKKDSGPKRLDDFAPLITVFKEEIRQKLRDLVREKMAVKRKDRYELRPGVSESYSSSAVFQILYRSKRPITLEEVSKRFQFLQIKPIVNDLTEEGFLIKQDGGYIINWKVERYFTDRRRILTATDSLQWLSSRAQGFLDSLKQLTDKRIDLQKKLQKDKVEDLRRFLTGIRGISYKIADCIIQQGGGRMEVAPVDINIARIINRLYFGRSPRRRTSIVPKREYFQVQGLLVNKYGKYAGYVESHLFSIGREYCKSIPLCLNCPLNIACEYNRLRTKRESIHSGF